MTFIEGFVRSLETVLEQAQVELVKKELFDNAELLAGGDFQNLRVRETIFGASERGAELGFHHGRAHQVIAETLDGVVQDMHDFCEGVKRAQMMLEDADAGAGSDLSRTAAAVAELEDANRWFAADHKYDQARNEGARNEVARTGGGGDGA